MALTQRKLSTRAVLLERPEHLALATLALTPPTSSDVIVEVEFSGISTGTERLLWSGRMPQFPGMGYPLVPGYESVGRVIEAGADTQLAVGTPVFVPGAKCFGEVRGLFGGAARHLVVEASRVIPLAEHLNEQGILLALAATAHHVASGEGNTQPDLIIGHGVLGRLIARLAVLAGTKPVVWETNVARHAGADGYEVVSPSDDSRNNYRVICDASGGANLLDKLIQRLAPGGEIILAGFYEDPMYFNFAPAFMREMRLRIAAQWRDTDLAAVLVLVQTGRLSLHDLITHRSQAIDASAAYRTAFTDPKCLKMILDWRTCS